MTTQTETLYRVPESDQIAGATVLHIGERGATMTITEARAEMVSRGSDAENVHEHDGYLFCGERIIGEPAA